MAMAHTERSTRKSTHPALHRSSSLPLTPWKRQLNAWKIVSGRSPPHGASGTSYMPPWCLAGHLLCGHRKPPGVCACENEEPCSDTRARACVCGAVARATAGRARAAGPRALRCKRDTQPGCQCRVWPVHAGTCACTSRRRRAARPHHNWAFGSRLDLQICRLQQHQQQHRPVWRTEARHPHSEQKGRPLCARTRGVTFQKQL